MANDDTAPPDTTRLFVALWPTPDVRDGLMAWQSLWRWPAGARPVGAGRLHLTLHYLGAVPNRQRDTLADALAVEAEPFELRLGRAVLWPHGIAVLEALATPPGLARLHGRLQEVLKAQQIRTETRPFRPHVTLARHAQGALPPADGPRLRWTVNAHVLVESCRAPNAGYRVLRRYADAP